MQNSACLRGKGPAAPPCSSPEPGGRAFALVIVLAFIVVLTALVVAYFSRAIADRQMSNGSLNRARADDLARSALDIITGNLKQEIANSGSGIAMGNTTVYTAPELIPVRNGTPAVVSGINPIPALLRVSATSATAGLVDFQASNAISTGTSANGRTISPARWNQHYLIPLQTPGTPANTTPVTGFTPPSWVYVTGSGGPANPPLAAPSSSVVGRYAYAVYDEGSLLDGNVAGYPAATSGTVPVQYVFKNALAFADLTQLTLGSGTTPLITQTGVNNLVGWRNYASMSGTGSPASGAFPALTFSFTGTTTLLNYENLILSNTNGFLAVSSANGLTDQAFLTRQELINLALATGSTNFNPNALQYLGTFSRALNAPSWRPSATTGSPPGNTVDYAGQANATSSVNRNIPNVRFANAGTVTHYRDDGTTQTYSVQTNDPLIQHRFSLARIAWLTPSGPAAGMAAAIQLCFGLQWNNTGWRWEYVGPTGSTTLHNIETLGQVANENPPREPNFFEFLKAGILNGSLGRDPGPGIDVSHNVNANGGVGVYASSFNTFKTEPNMQILQIGGDIIDQYHTDSYPTAIHLNPFGLTGADDLSIQTVYGIKNLPYLNGLMVVAIADPIPQEVVQTSGTVVTTTVTPGTLKSWIQPQLWNPHQVPSSAGTNYPSEFRAYAYGTVFSTWYDSNIGNNANIGPETHYDDGTGTEATPGHPGEIYFFDTGNATSPFYNIPCPLTLDLTSSNGSNSVAIVDTNLTPAANCYDSTKWSALGGDITPPNRFAGFCLVGDSNYNADPVKDTVQAKYILPDNTSLFYVSLQYKGPDSNYHPYTFMARIAQDQSPKSKHLKASPEGNALTDGTSGPPIVPHTTVVGETETGGWGPTRADPRTDRFSESTQWWSNLNRRTRTMNESPNTYIEPAGSGAGGTGDYSIPYISGTCFTYTPAYTPANPALPPLYPPGGPISLWLNNDSSYLPTSGFTNPSSAYYSDPDGVVRYADGYRSNVLTGDGCELYDGNATVANYAGKSTTPVLTGTAPNLGNTSAQARRPVILNRPFHSVGEIGYAFRDLPYKSVDFWSPTSPDGALLDLFSLTDQPPAAAGQISLNNTTAPVLKAIFSGASKSSTLGLQMSGSDTITLSGTIAADIATNGPYGNRGDLATRLGPLVSSTTSQAAFNTTIDTTTTSYANWANKAYAEAPMRALADVTNTRTWNLLIDVVAQSGAFTPGATDLVKNFVVQGERRYWLHVAIDRFTGKIVDEQLEPVYE